MKKIFLGWIDVCGQLGDHQKAYKKLGYKTFSMVLSRELASEDTKFSWLVYPDWIFLTNCKFLIFLRKLYTALLLPPMRFFFWIFAAFYFDIFHFMWVPEKYNIVLLWVLKLLKKKIIIGFVGSDIRWVPLWVKEFKMRNLDHPDVETNMKAVISSKSTLNDKLRYLRIFEKYADVIISGPEQAQLQLRPYTYFFLPVDLDKIPYKERNNDIPIVCIGVSSHLIKGAQEVIKNIEEFQKTSKIKFGLKIIRNMTHVEVLDLLSRCDIFVYSPYMCGTGKFGMEALAAGAVTLTGYDKDWIKYPLNSPVVHIQEDTMIEKIDYYLQNPEVRKNLSKQSREYAIENADVYKITKNILTVLNSKEKFYHYYPSFFREHATFDTEWDSPDSIEICNKWNDYVRNCNWYKEFIPPGERAGIKF